LDALSGRSFLALFPLRDGPRFSSVVVFALRLPSLISLCGFGGILSKRSAIRRVGSSKSGFFVMPDLNPEISSLALVGRFLKRVCDLEEKLNEAIAGILNIDDTKRFILCANIQFRHKIHILRAFAKNSSLPDSDKEQFDTELRKMGNLYGDRNTIAHQYFKLAPAGDGIIFSIVHMNGGAAPLETPWTKTKFDELDNLLEGMLATATRLRVALTDGTFMLQRRDLSWLHWFGGQADTPLPMRHTMSPALHDSLSRPTQSPPDSGLHLTSPKATEKTPEEPPEKK
jgi:hypothetical protein